jgi:hypothetical protein
MSELLRGMLQETYVKDLSKRAGIEWEGEAGHSLGPVNLHANGLERQ